MVCLSDGPHQRKVRLLHSLSPPIRPGPWPCMYYRIKYMMYVYICLPMYVYVHTYMYIHIHDRFPLLLKPPPNVKNPKGVLILGGGYLPCKKLLPKPPEHDYVHSLTNEVPNSYYISSFLYKSLFKILLKTQKTLKSKRSLVLITTPVLFYTNFSLQTY